MPSVLAMFFAPRVGTELVSFLTILLLLITLFCSEVSPISKLHIKSCSVQGKRCSHSAPKGHRDSTVLVSKEPCIPHNTQVGEAKVKLEKKLPAERLKPGHL